MASSAAPAGDITRRGFIGSAALLTLLAGCGAPAAPAAVEAPGYPRTVTDGTGRDVVIPARPTRIACGQNVWDLDAVLALGQIPVQFGLRDFAEYTGSPTTSWPWHEKALAGAEPAPERIPVGESLSVETIARSRPDLIIGDDALAEPRSRLEALAPVLQVASFDWRRNLRMVGTALDLLPEAEALITQTDLRLANALRTFTFSTPPKVATFATYDNTAFYFFGNSSIPTIDLFERAGFATIDALAAAATPDEPRVTYSPEKLGLLEPAELVVVFNYGDGGTAPPLLANPLFARLPAARAGRVIVIPQGERVQGLSVFGPLNLQLGLDLVTEAAGLLTTPRG